MLWNKVLLIFDGSENAIRATEYVAKMFGQVDGIEVTIFGLYEKLPRHDFKDESPVVGKLDKQIRGMELEIERGQARIQDAKSLLARAGLKDSAISAKYVERKQSAIKDVVNEAKSGGYGTVVVGRGESKGVLTGGEVAKELQSTLKNRAVCIV